MNATENPEPSHSSWTKSGPLTLAVKFKSTIKVESHPAEESRVTLPLGLFSSKVTFPLLRSVKAIENPEPSHSSWTKSGPFTPAVKFKSTIKVESQPAEESSVTFPVGLFSSKVTLPLLTSVKATENPEPSHSSWVKSGPLTPAVKFKSTIKVESQPAEERSVTFPLGLFSSKVTFPLLTSVKATEKPEPWHSS